MTFTLPGKRISAVYYPRPLGEGRVRVLLIIVLAATLLGKATFAADKIRIGYSGITISNALLWVTEEGKLFEKNGIDAEVLYLQTTLGQTARSAGACN
jgi:ABC-type nitrate/sulfonate/bicarbonate transport system substrate-binding protein